MAPPTSDTERDPGRFLLRSPLRGLVKAALVHGQAAVWAVRGARVEPGLRILYYHRVGPGNDQLTVSPARFRRQMELIDRAGVRVVDLSALPDLELGPGASAVAITFDDGYRDIVDHALPALEARGWPATVYVVPDAVDGTVGYRWYRRTPDLISWAEMRRIEGTGLVHIEPHSMTHPDLTTLDRASAAHEIGGSKAALEDRLGRPARSFCYPGGFFGEREVELVEEAGYETAVGCEYGVNRAPWDRFALRRILVDRYDTSPLFAARLRGATDSPPLGRRKRGETAVSGAGPPAIG
jgi:peptidoglycan/xylan/chitin deacetylase (PgdA/CDA1 family)